MGDSLTHNYNLFDKTHEDFFIAAPYPMALWFLDNWWRLCFEPTPDEPTTDWRRSHMLSAAGYGYSWPTIGFQSDSQNITVTSIPTPGSFTNACTHTIPRPTFARAVCTFVEDCLHYAADADLEASYATVQHEQTDEEVSLYRTLEALQGFDAGYGNEDRLQFLVRTAKVYDPETIRELSRFLYDCPELEDEMQAVKKGILGCKIDIGSLDMNAVQIDATAKPWEVGFSLARQVRCQWNLNGPVTNEALCERVSLRAEEFDCADRDSAVGFGARMSDAVFSLKFAKRSRTSSRFMFTRGICDAIVAEKASPIFSP